MKNRLRAVLLIILAATAGQAAAEGRWQRSPRDVDPGYRMARKGGYSLDDAVSGARRKNPGKVLSADTVDDNGRPVHRIRILNDQGRVRGYRYDGDTGQPLSYPDRPPSRRQSR